MGTVPREFTELEQACPVEFSAALATARELGGNL
jgi:hypothetical protein